MVTWKILFGLFCGSAVVAASLAFVVAADFSDEGVAHDKKALISSAKVAYDEAVRLPLMTPGGGDYDSE